MTLKSCPKRYRQACRQRRDAYADGAERYVITFTRHSDIASTKLVEELPWPRKAAAKLLRFDGAYLRFVGELRLEHYQGKALVESHVEDALWELMYFGKARP